MKLNLGSGDQLLPGFINTDIREIADKQWDFREPIPLNDNSVDFILAWHILEHAGLHEGGSMVKDWYRVLKPGGKLCIAVPNILKRFEMYQQGVIGENPWYQLMVSIYGPWHGVDGDYHKWGYNKEGLEKLLNEAGFQIKVLWFDNTPGEIIEFTRSLDDNPPLISFADWALQYVCQK